MGYDGDSYGGRTLKVAKADGKGKGRDKGKSKGKGKVGPKPSGCSAVVVKGLSYEATEEDLQGLFGKCDQGPSDVRILTDKETGQSRGTAFVNFDDDGGLDEAVKLSGTELKGRTFFVDYARPRQE